MEVEPQLYVHDINIILTVALGDNRVPTGFHFQLIYVPNIRIYVCMYTYVYICIYSYICVYNIIYIG